jgi:hypothetical protein
LDDHKYNDEINYAVIGGPDVILIYIRIQNMTIYDTRGQPTRTFAMSFKE